MDACQAWVWVLSKKLYFVVSRTYVNLIDNKMSVCRLTQCNQYTVTASMSSCESILFFSLFISIFCCCLLCLIVVCSCYHTFHVFVVLYTSRWPQLISGKRSRSIWDLMQKSKFTWILFWHSQTSFVAHFLLQQLHVHTHTGDKSTQILVCFRSWKFSPNNYCLKTIT